MSQCRCGSSICFARNSLQEYQMNIRYWERSLAEGRYPECTEPMTEQDKIECKASIERTKERITLRLARIKELEREAVLKRRQAKQSPRPADAGTKS